MPFYAATVSINYWKRIMPLRADDKRVSLLFSFHGPLGCLEGSMTVEAALAVPLYIFFLCNVLFLIEAVRMESSLSAALHETGLALSEYAWYAQQVDRLTEGGETEADPAGAENQPGADSARTPEGMLVSAALSEGYARTSVLQWLEQNGQTGECISGGPDSISFLGSSVLEEDGILDLRTTYRIRPFLSMLGPAEFLQENRWYAHAFTGYDVTRASEEPLDEEMVFITPYGMVYHRSRGCSYLKPSIQTVRESSVAHRRNDQGGKYYPCELCHPGTEGLVLITSDGDRYHVNRADGSRCSGLRRTIMEVPLSSVEDRMKPCGRCGAG